MLPRDGVYGGKCNISRQDSTNQMRRNLQKSGTAYWPIPFLSPLPFPSLFSLPFLPLSFPLLEIGPLKPARGLGSAVSSPSGVRGGAPAENEFGAVWSCRKPYWLQYSEVHVSL